MSQHFSASIYIGDYLVTGELSDARFELTELSDDKMCAQRVLSNQLMKVCDQEENELQALELEYGDEELDDTIEDEEESTTSTDVDVQKEIERLDKEEDIINKYQKEQDKLTRDAKILEDDYNKKISNKELQIQVLEQEKQTYDDYLDQTNMGYFDN